jgi:TonB-dependent receptor
MISRYRNFLLYTAALAVCPLGAALAQDTVETTTPATGDETRVEDVVVITGQRGSIINSLAAKEAADSVTDILSADQAGRFPDPNIAESLARIPGISFQRENDTGQGEFISIRGLDASYNTVLFDGLRTGTADPFRRTALDIVTANNISSVRVTKAPLPMDATEGIGGVVDIRTRGPLERPERSYLSFDLRDKTFNDDTGYRLSGGTTRQITDRLGVNLSVSYRKTFIDTIYTNPASFTLEQIAPAQITGPDGQVATFIDESEIDLVPEGFLPTSLFTNEQINFEDNDIERENLNIAGAIQYELTDNTTLTFGGRYTQDDTFQTVSNIEFDADNGDITCASDEFGGDDDAFEDASPFDRTACTDIANSDFPDPEVTFEGQIEDSEEIQERYFLRGETFLDQWSFEYTVGYSRAFEDEPVLSIDFTNDFDRVPGGTSDNDVTFVPMDFSNPNFPAPLPKDLDVFLLGIDPYCENPERSDGRCGEINDFDESIEDSRENTRTAAKFDGQYDFVNDGVFENVKFGFQYELSEYDQVEFDISDVDDSLGLNGEFLGIDRSGEPGGSLGDNNAVIGDFGLFNGPVASFDRIGNPYRDIGLLGVPKVDPTRLRQLRANFRRGFFESGSNFRDIERIASEESFYTGYGQAKLTFGKLDIVGGVRLEQYEGDFSAPVSFDGVLIESIDGEGNVIDLDTNEDFAQARTSTDNFEVLPRIAFNYNLRDDMKIRASYTTALARPTFDLLAAEVDGNFSVDLVDGVTTAAATAGDVESVTLRYDLGNPELKNAYSQNFDLSYEWYIDDSNAFAVAVFYKQIDDFIFNTFALEGDLGAIPGDFDPLTAVQTAPFSDDGLALINQLGGFEGLLGVNNSDIRVRAPANGDEATVYGLELSFFHTFEYLPGAFSNLGVAGNVTLQETETTIRLGELDANDALVVLGLAEEGDVLERDFAFFNSPDVTGNANIFYEDDSWEVVLAYRYAGRQLEEISSFGFAQYVQDRGFLDLDVDYTLPDFGTGLNRATVFFSANDLLDDGTEPTTYETNDIDGDLPNFASYNGRNYRVGLRISF